MKFLGYFIVFVILCIPVKCYRSLYFKNITAVLIQKGKSSLVSLKPTKRFFRSVSLGRPSSLVSLGSGYFAFIVPGDDDLLSFESFTFPSGIFVLYRTRFGRYKSIDVSDRCLSDVLSKFK